MPFLEELPNECPPQDAHDGACDIAFRFVSKEKPGPEDFASSAAKQEPLPPGVDPCRWASCSLFTSLETVKKKRDTFKKLRTYPFVAQIKIAAGSGRLLEGTGHIDFWMYDNFDPVAAIVNVHGF